MRVACTSWCVPCRAMLTVSQICSFMRFSSMLIIRRTKSTPTAIENTYINVHILFTYLVGFPHRVFNGLSKHCSEIIIKPTTEVIAYKYNIFTQLWKMWYILHTVWLNLPMQESVIPFHLNISTVIMWVIAVRNCSVQCAIETTY